MGQSADGALLTLGSAQDTLAPAWPALLAGQHAGLQTVVRLALQRYVKHGIGDVTVLEPLIRLANCGQDDLDLDTWYGSGLGRQIRELMMAWLLGLIVTGSGPDELRRRVRDRILASNPEPYEEPAVEALALLGPDLDEHAEAFLRGLAATQGGHLAAVVESAGAALAMSAFQPRLLLTLSQAYYITTPGMTCGHAPCSAGSGPTGELPAARLPPGTTGRSTSC